VLFREFSNGSFCFAVPETESFETGAILSAVSGIEAVRIEKGYFGDILKGLIIGFE